MLKLALLSLSNHVVNLADTLQDNKKVAGSDYWQHIDESGREDALTTDAYDRLNFEKFSSPFPAKSHVIILTFTLSRLSLYLTDLAPPCGQIYERHVSVQWVVNALLKLNIIFPWAAID